MVEKVNPSINRPASAFKTAGAIALAGGSADGWVSESGKPTDISVEDADITESSLSAFAESSGSTSLDVTISGGEAFVYGSWLAIDTQTTVTLAASTSGQTVYVGWNKGGSDDVIIGLDTAFSDASGDTDEKLPLFTYDTDASGVTAVSDDRQLGKYVEADTANLENISVGTTLVTDADSPYTTSGEGIVFADSSSAPVEVVLGSTDRRDGLGVAVIDVGGAAGTNAITISTERSETIDGGASSLIEAEYGAKRLASDGTNWFSAGGGSGAGGVPVEDNGSLVLDPAKNINFGNALSVSGDGDDTVTIDGVQYTDEQAQDAVAGDFLTAGNALTKEYLDNTNTLTLDVSTNGIKETELDESITPRWTGEHEFTAGISDLPEPIQDTDAARKVYVDSVAEGLDIKESVQVCTETNIDLSSSTDPNPVDGVSLGDGDRVLLKSQTDGTENGIYVATTATDPTTWVRSDDADGDSEVNSGLFVFVEDGSTHANQGFVLSTNDPITLGTTTINFTQFSGAESFTAGSGIEQTNNTISHSDTSTQSDLSSSAGSAIVDLTFDDFGHVTGASTDSFDGRYLSLTGGTITGDFTVDSAMFVDQSTGDVDIAGELTENTSI